MYNLRGLILLCIMFISRQCDTNKSNLNKTLLTLKILCHVLAIPLLAEFIVLQKALIFTSALTASKLQAEGILRYVSHIAKEEMLDK